MIVLGPLLVVASIGFCCWLLFNLATYALPFFVGLTIGVWVFHAGAGLLGAMALGAIAAGATVGIGQLALALVPRTWARLLIVLGYAAPAAFAGYCAAFGIAKLAMPSPTWQAAFAVVGAIAVGITAFIRLIETAKPAKAGQAVTST